MPYAVPAGYFVRLPEVVMCRLELYGSALHLEGRKIANGYFVPSGYFDRFAESVLCRIELEGSMLGGENGKVGHPFTVPAGYFPSSEEGVVSTDRESNRVAGSGHTATPFEVPVGYFERFFDHLSEGVYADDPKLLLPRNAPFAVPDGYFDSLPGQMAAAVRVVAGNGKRVPLLGMRLWKVAGVAAAVAAVVVAVFIARPGVQAANSPDSVLGSVSGKEISEYASQNYLDLEQTANATDNSALRFDSRDIIKYLNETGWEGTD